MIQKNILNACKQEPVSVQELRLVELAQSNKIILPNKVELYYMIANNIDLIKLTIIFKNNSIWSKENALNALAVSKLIKEGSYKYSSEKLKFLIELNGAKLFVNNNNDYITIDIYVIKENFAKILTLLQEIVINAAFPLVEIDKFIVKSKNTLLANMQKNQYLANQAFKALIFGTNNKLGYNIKQEDFDNINQNKLIKHYKENFQADNCTVIATGNLSDSDIKLLKEIFISLPFSSGISKNSSINTKEGIKPDKQNKKHIQGANKLQSTIIVGKKFPNKNHPDYLKLQILNTILGGYFGSYLMKNLREEKGYTYGVHSAINSNLTTGVFYINTEVNVKNYKAALSEIYKEINNLVSSDITDETINVIKNYSIGEFRSSIKNIFSYSNLLTGTLFYNVGYPLYYQQYFEELQSINKKELKQLAAKYFSSGFYEVVVGI